LFTAVYLNHYLKYDTPAFHLEIYQKLQDKSVQFQELIAFRGSAKSTIASLAFPLWSAVTGRKNFILICSDSFSQAKLLIANIIYELEGNELLEKDFGDFKTKEEWTATSLVLKNGTRIISRSRGQKVRGLRWKENRPDLIIADDVENTDSVRQKEQRDKTEEWFTGDVIPSMDIDEGKLVLIGNLLHTDSLMIRMQKNFVVDQYPLIDERGNCLWSERFSKEGLTQLRKNVVNDRFYLREYMLKIIPDEGQVITRIEHYQKLPKLRALAIGCDLAISQKDSADYTAFVVAGEGTDGKIYTLHSEHARISFNDTLSRLNDLYTNYRKVHKDIPIYVGWEDVAYQRAGIEEAIRRYKIPVVGIKRSTDKRSRLQTLEPYFVSSQILLRERGDEDLELQIINFGVEAYDDLMDAGEIAYNLIIGSDKPDIDFL